jgi:GNAT superfamily N-acetyltransferase
MAAGSLTFKPVTPATRADFEALFDAPGGPKYCWCMAWRTTSQEARTLSGPQRRPLIMGRIARGEPVGLLGYEAGRPVAWVSIAPKETYHRLGGPEPAAGERIWALACMYIPRALRGRGLAHALIAAAADYARREGATAVEAYPVDPESPSYRFMGFVSAFEAAGFTEVGRAGSRRHVMRLTLSDAGRVQN